MPGGSVGPEGDPKAEKQEEEEESDGHEGDKLYCVCKTKYDEDRFMIACDRCVLPTGAWTRPDIVSVFQL